MFGSIFFGATLATQSLNWNGPKVFTMSGKANRHSYSVRLEQANWQTKGRRLLWLDMKVDPGGPRYIKLTTKANWDPNWSSIFPGFEHKGHLHRLYGTDGMGYDESQRTDLKSKLAKATELVGVSVTIDGKRLTVSRELYWDLLRPGLNRRVTRVAISKEGKVLIVGMGGSDGAGCYFVEWRFRTNGKHSRAMLDPESELSMLPAIPPAASRRSGGPP